MNFLEAYLHNCVSFKKLDDWIEYWHTHEVKNTLQEFLGFDDEEYEYLSRMDDDQAKGYINLKYKIKN